MLKAIGNAIRNVTEFIDSSNSIVLQLNQTTFLPGEVVSGTVTLNCTVPFKARSVFVKLKGFEFASFEETRKVMKTKHVGRGRRKKSTKSRLICNTSKRHFFNVKLLVYPNPGMMAPGVYRFPFQFQLPARLPGSFRQQGNTWGSGRCFEALIEYYTEASIDVAFRHNLKHRTYFIINERVDSQIIPSAAENSKTFLIASGRLSSKVILDNNVYSPGSVLVAKFVANNTSFKRTTRVVIKLIRMLRLAANGRERIFTNEVSRQAYTGFAAMFFGIRWLSFRLPVNLQPSTSLGSCIQCAYQLHVECDVPASSNLVIQLPVKICAPQWLYSNAPIVPPDFRLPPDVTFRPPWQQESAVSNCNKCHTKFSIALWRHHCRHCGRIFCGKCLPHKLPMRNLGYDEPELCCADCHEVVHQGGQWYQAPVDFIPPPPPPQFLPPLVPQATLPLLQAVQPQLPPGAPPLPPGYMPILEVLPQHAPSAPPFDEDDERRFMVQGTMQRSDLALSKSFERRCKQDGLCEASGNNHPSHLHQPPGYPSALDSSGFSAHQPHPLGLYNMSPSQPQDMHRIIPVPQPYPYGLPQQQYVPK